MIINWGPLGDFTSKHQYESFIFTISNAIGSQSALIRVPNAVMAMVEMMNGGNHTVGYGKVVWRFEASNQLHNVLDVQVEPGRIRMW